MTKVKLEQYIWTWSFMTCSCLGSETQTLALLHMRRLRACQVPNSLDEEPDNIRTGSLFSFCEGENITSGTQTWTHGFIVLT